MKIKKELPLRTGVGIALLNHENKIFVGKRIDNPANSWQMPQGGVDENEDFLQAAKRELEEETGYQTTELKPLNSFFLSPGILNERMHLFVATKLTAGPAQREPGEQIENYVVPWDKAMKMACDGTIQDAKTLVGLLLYDQIRR